ncbi:metal-dependent hydrolase [Ralstonia pseudosolanacearum]|uniref:metal-dependent hydrolase n=1 Tax=Ralstonia pseudosolanacearum TaxID=1310165 RepID=UPI003CEC139E
MSSKTAHYAAGVLLGLGVAYAVHDTFTGWQTLTIFLGSLWGTSAPDWLEISGWTWWGTRLSLIPHRTVTHWMLGWVLLTAWVAIQAYTIGSLGWCVAFGFCLSALSHVVMDYWTPMSVPVFHPYKRARRRGGRR